MIIEVLPSSTGYHDGDITLAPPSLRTEVVDLYEEFDLPDLRLLAS